MNYEIFRDNIHIFYDIFGEKGDWIVIANAPGMTEKFFYPIIDKLKNQFRILIWCYRGITPSSDVFDKSKLELFHHALDLKFILNENNITSAHMIGWCIGPKVILELFKYNPELFKSFTFLNFSYNIISQWEESTDFDISMSKIAQVLKENPLKGKLMIKLIKEFQANNFETLLDLIDGFENKEYFLDLINTMGDQSNISDLSLNKFENETDIINYLIIYNNFVEYYCIDTIKTINIPTLILAGSKDSWVPPRTLEHLQTLIKNSTYIEIEDATHYLLLEKSQLVVNEFQTFISGVIF